MTDKEKRELKDGVISIFKSFNILDHTATIGGLQNDILECINSMQEESVSSVWYDARKTIPEDSAKQIICIKEDKLAIATIGKIIRGTVKWAYLDDLLNLSNVERTIKNRKETPVSKELEKAAVEAFKQIVDSDKNNFLEIFKAGAEWQKQQIMKEAVDGLVICDELTHGYKDIAMHIPNNLEVGDKVRLIIIKEE